MEFPPSTSSVVRAKNATSSVTTTTPLDCFRRPGGVLLLVMSLVSSRGAQIVQSEMDDPAGSKLTSQFGHCGQELINLLLTGQAVSNVFDNTLTPSGGELICRGIQYRPMVGYLSQLEALRYCEVGGYYKSPKFPIWVVGSTSHFTVLFGPPSCLKETASDIILEKCRRAFKAVEGGEENGFIASQNLGTVLKSLDLNLGNETAIQTLAASLEVSEAGIILWDDFWKATSRLLTGASLDNILLSQGTTNAGIINIDDNAANPNISESDMVDNSAAPLLITQGSGEDDQPNASQPCNMQHQFIEEDVDLDRKPSAKQQHQETDEEMAKRLSSEWDYKEQQQRNPQSQHLSDQHVVRIASPMQVETPNVGNYSGLSDEELARRLQAEWDAEISGGVGGAESSVAAVNGSPLSSAPSQQLWKSPGLSTPDYNNNGNNENTIVDTNVPNNNNTSNTNNVVLEFEKYGDSFPLYHYNGLRGGMLTPFRVTRLSAEEAVGTSIALNRGGHAFSSTGVGGGSGDLEDVIRTKWPSCMINWLGKSPPYID